MGKQNYVVDIDRMDHPVASRIFLNAKLQEVYWMVAEAVARMNEYVIIPELRGREWCYIAEALAYDFPQFFYWKDWETIQYQSYAADGRKTKKIQLIYFYDKDTACHKMRKIEQEANRIINQCIYSKKTEREKIYAIHSYLASNLRYTDKKKVNEKGMYPDYSYTLESLIRGDGVCRGLSAANIFLLRKLQIECASVSSNNHAWNIIKLRTGEIYFSDIAWDTHHVGNYQYFMLTEDEMRAVEHHKTTGLYPERMMGG